MVQFLKSKQVTYKNRPVGVVSVNTGAVEAELQTAKLFERGQALAWEEAKQDAIQSDINKAKTLPIEDADGNLSLEKIEFTDVGEQSANAILEQRYSGFVQNKINKQLGEIHAKNPFNKTKFDTEAQGLIKGWVDVFKKEGMGQYVPEFLDKVTNKSILHSNKILNDTIKKEKDDAALLDQDALFEFEQVALLYPEDASLILDQHSKTIERLKKGRYIQGPAIRDAESRLKRNFMIGEVTKLVDLVGQDPLAIKYIEDIFQNKKASIETYERVVKASRGQISMAQLSNLNNLRDKYEADRTDTNVITQFISNRSGDVSKQLTLIGKERTSNNVGLQLQGIGVDTAGFLPNTKDNRAVVNNELSKSLGFQVNETSFFQMNNAQYDKTLASLSNVPVLPTTLDNIFKGNMLNFPAFRSLSERDKRSYAARELNTWNNLAYNTGAGGRRERRLQGYDKQYEKYTFIDEIARVNGNDLIKAYSLYHTKVDDADTYKGMIMSSLADMNFGDLKIGNVNAGVEAIFDEAEIPRHHRSQLDSYVEKLLFYKSVKMPDGTSVEMDKDNLLSVLKDTYKLMFVEDTDVYDVFNLNNTGLTYFTPKKKYTGVAYASHDDFRKWTQSLITKQLGEEYILGENTFLLPDAKNSQYGDQRYTFVNIDGEIIPSQLEGGVAVEFTTREYERDNNISITEINNRSLNQSVELRALAMNRNKQLTEKEKKGLDLYRLPNKVIIDDPNFFESMMDTDYFTNQFSKKGYDNPLWNMITDTVVNNLSLPDKFLNMLKEFMTPDVAVGVQDGLIDIFQNTAVNEGFQSQVYRDRNTISVGYGFNVRYLTEKDYKNINPEMRKPLKELQKKLNKKKYSEDELNAMVNEFKFGKPILFKKDKAAKIFRSKMMDIYAQYEKEFPNFNELHPLRRSALIDFSYQFGHERLKKGFPKYYEAVKKAINTSDIDQRNFHFREAGFHQVYNQGEFGNTKTPLFYQTKRRVRKRVGDLGFDIKDDVDFIDEEFS
jgi:hypothetical protein